MPPQRTIATAFALTLALISHGQAQTWTGNTDNDWRTANNWTSPASIPGDSYGGGGAAIFDTGTTGNVAPNITGNHVFPDTIQFTNTSGTGTTAYTITGDRSLIIKAGGGITVDSSVTSDQTFSASLRPDDGTTTFTNNGTGLLTFGTVQNYWNPDPNQSDVVFDGSGDINVTRLMDRDANRIMSVDKYGDGTLTITGTSTYSLQTRLFDNGVIRLESNDALGTTAGNTYIAGNVDNGGHVALTGGLTVAESFLLGARQSTTQNSAHIRNVSGNNTLTGNIATDTGGSYFNLQSDAGLLTIEGDFSEDTSGTDRLQLLGEGDGLITGDILNPTSTSGSGTQSTLEIFKDGGGTWTLAGTTDTRDPANSSSVGELTVLDGTLGAAGTIYANVTVNIGGTIGAGSAIGTGNVFGDMTILGTLEVQIDGAQTDLLNITGDLDLSGGSNVLDVDGQNLAGPYVIATYSGSLTGTFATEILPGGWSVDYGTGSNSQITLVPEPSAMILLGLSAMTLLHRRRRD